MHYLAAISRMALALVALFSLTAWPARADSWAPPEVATYVSANGQYRLTVIPREIGSQLAYFEAKARGETLPEPAGPLGRFERKEGVEWVSVWSRGLVNEVAPVDAIVGDDGQRVITFDNWHSTGYGDDVVVIYGEKGALVRSLRLDQIVPPYFIDALPTSVSSIHWRSGEPRFVYGALEIGVAEPSEDFGEDKSFPVRIAMEDGAVEPMAAEMLARLSPLVCALHTGQVKSFNEYLANERADLVYPGSTDKNAWQRYIHNAIARLQEVSADSADGFPSWMHDEPNILLNDGEYMEKDFRDGFRHALTIASSEEPRRWFAARDQTKMVREVERIARKTKAGQLAGVELRFFADEQHWPKIRSALAASGARLMQVDLAAPIPQRQDALADLPPARAINASCAATDS